MFQYNGKLTYLGGSRDKETVVADLLIGFFPPRVTVSIHDLYYETNHKLINSRFNFHSRDSHADLLARDAWETDWMDVFKGVMHLVMPAITGVSHQLDVMMFASWWPAFVIIEFQLGADYISIATRPRASLNSRWLRCNPNHPPPSPDRPQPLNSTIGQRMNQSDEDSPGRRTDPASSSNQPCPMESEPDDPVIIDYERR